MSTIEAEKEAMEGDGMQNIVAEILGRSVSKRSAVDNMMTLIAEERLKAFELGRGIGKEEVRREVIRALSIFDKEHWRKHTQVSWNTIKRKVTQLKDQFKTIIL